MTDSLSMSHTLPPDGRAGVISAEPMAVSASAVSESLGKGLEYLRERYEAWGGWSDFSTRSSGKSTTWITAYVLIRVGRLLPASLRRNAVDFLIKSQSDSGGWGFSEKTPPDCDSTAHSLAACLMCCDGTSRFGEANLLRALDFISKHLKEDGGFSTYCSATKLSSYRRRPNEEDYGGWLSSHACTAVSVLRALQVLPAPTAKELVANTSAYFLGTQTDDGLWKAYWWRSNFFVAAELLPTLMKLVPKNMQGRLADGLTSIAEAQDLSGYWDNGVDADEPCTISTALCVKMFAELGKDTLRQRTGARFLVSTQKQDGSWRGKAILQIPPPNVTAPWRSHDWRIAGRGVGSCCCDDEGIYSTTTVVSALVAYLKDTRNA